MWLVILRFGGICFLDVITGWLWCWFQGLLLIRSAILHWSQDLCVVFNKLFKGITNRTGILSLWLALRKRYSRWVFVARLIGIFLLLGWSILIGLYWNFLLTIISLILNPSRNFLFNSRATHLINGIILIWRFHDFWNWWLGFKLLMMCWFCVEMAIPLLLGVGDCSTLVLLFQPGLFSTLLYPLELILLSRMWFAAETG